MKHVLYFCIPDKGEKRDNDYKCFLNYLHSFSSLSSFTKYKHVTGIIALLLCHPSNHIFPTIIVIMLQGLYISPLCSFLKKFIINSFALFRILLFLLPLLLHTSIPVLINVWLVNLKQKKLRLPSWCWCCWACNIHTYIHKYIHTLTMHLLHWFFFRNAILRPCLYTIFKTANWLLTVKLKVVSKIPIIK